MAFNPNFPGSSTGSTTTYNLDAFLRVYGGEVVAEYNKAAVIKDKLRHRNITHGKSASFPTITKSSAKVHTPGDDLYSGSTYNSTMANDEQIVQVNKMLIDHAFVDGLDEAMQHYDSRSEYAAQMGAALGVGVDTWSIAALTAGTAGNTSATLYASLTTADKLAQIQTMAGDFDNNGVPKGDRCVIVQPEDFYNFIDEDGVVSKDFGQGADRGKPGSLHYMGFEVLNSAVWTDFVNKAGLTGAGEPLENIPTRDGIDTDLTKTWGLGFHKSAAGLVNLKGMMIDVDWIPQRQGHQITAKQACGVGILRPAAAGLLKGA